MLNKDIYRQCLVDDQKGIFHGWVIDDRLLINTNPLLASARRAFNLPSQDMSSMNIIGSTVALIEFEDGSVRKIDPEKLIFVDSSELFHEMVWIGVDLASGPDRTGWGKTAMWIVWPGWEGNHDRRIEDAKCSSCGYRHETVYGSLRRLSSLCPGCGSKMNGVTPSL